MSGSICNFLSVFIPIVAPFFGCAAENAVTKPDYIITPFVWSKEDPSNVPILNIRTKGTNPWAPQLTTLYGPISREQWMLVPYALRRLCKEIPDLPERTVQIYREKEGSRMGKDHQANYSGGKEGQYQLVFYDSANPANPYPLRLSLGADWCKKKEQRLNTEP